MRDLNIITTSFFDFKKQTIKIGGVETYIKDLSLLGLKLGLNVRVFQISQNSEDSIKFEGINIYKVQSKKTLFKSINQNAFDLIFKAYNNEEAKFIIATDQMDIKSKANNVITIQHGIAFDIPGYLIKGFWGKNKSLQFINKMLRCIKNIKRFYHTKNSICVDYNYFNWFRTLGTIYPDYTMKVIPNYANNCISEKELINKLSQNNQKIKILFARRFVDYRGTLLFANVIEKLLLERNNIDITFAGNGPLENELKNKFSNNPNVHFTSFYAGDSIKFHRNFDIAVVPTIFSEGTSLSLCEAMAAGCFPIATHVGGMTNMILDNFNGILCYPSFDDLYKNINQALSLPKEKFNTIVTNSYNTASSAFSKTNWENKWSNLLLNK